MRRIIITVLQVGLLASAVWAHNFWVRPLGEGFRICLGHGEESESYPRSHVTRVTVYNEKGQAVSVSEDFGDKGLLLKVACATVGAVVAEIDYGTWIKTIHGWKLGTKSSGGDRVLKSVRNLQYCKLLRSQSIQMKVDLPLDFVIEKVEVGTLEGRLEYLGRPVPERPLFHGHERLGKTDAQGHFRLERPNDNNAAWVVTSDIEQDLEGNPDADRKTLTTTITVLP